MAGRFPQDNEKPGERKFDWEIARDLIRDQEEAMLAAIRAEMQEELIPISRHFDSDIIVESPSDVSSSSDMDLCDGAVASASNAAGNEADATPICDSTTTNPSTRERGTQSSPDREVGTVDSSTQWSPPSHMAGPSTSGTYAVVSASSSASGTGEVSSTTDITEPVISTSPIPEPETTINVIQKAENEVQKSSRPREFGARAKDCRASLFGKREKQARINLEHPGESSKSAGMMTKSTPIFFRPDLPALISSQIPRCEFNVATNSEDVHPNSKIKVQKLQAGTISPLIQEELNALLSKIFVSKKDFHSCMIDVVHLFQVGLKKDLKILIEELVRKKIQEGKSTIESKSFKDFDSLLKPVMASIELKTPESAIMRHDSLPKFDAVPKDSTLPKPSNLEDYCLPKPVMVSKVKTTLKSAIIFTTSTSQANITKPSTAFNKEMKLKSTFPIENINSDSIPEPRDIELNASESDVIMTPAKENPLPKDVVFSHDVNLPAPITNPDKCQTQVATVSGEKELLKPTLDAAAALPQDPTIALPKRELNECLATVSGEKSLPKATLDAATALPRDPTITFPKRELSEGLKFLNSIIVPTGMKKLRSHQRQKSAAELDTPDNVIVVDNAIPRRYVLTPEDISLPILIPGEDRTEMTEEERYHHYVRNAAIYTLHKEKCSKKSNQNTKN